MNKVKKAIHKGFTLVELLIVVIILAILAAIVVPQFSASTDDAKLAALDSNLSAMRSAINFYYQQHGEYPGENSSALSGGVSCSTVPTPAASDAAGHAAYQMTTYTANEGQACAIKDATEFPYGPYLREIPNNPFTDSQTITTTNDGRLAHTSSSTTGGWVYDIQSGRIAADHVDHVTR